MSAIKEYYMDLSYRIADAYMECDPFDATYSEIADETMELVFTGHVSAIANYFLDQLEDLDAASAKEIFPYTVSILPELLPFVEAELERAKS